MIDQLGKLFSQQHDWQHGDQEQERVPHYFTSLRATPIRHSWDSNHRFRVGARFDEEIPVASSLDRKENPIEKNRKEREENCLREREAAGGSRSREVRQNKRDHRKWHDDSKVRRRSLKIVRLGMMAQPT